MEGVYDLTGSETIVKSIETVDCGEVVTKKYFLEGNPEPVRVDKTINVDIAFLAKAFSYKR